MSLEHPLEWSDVSIGEPAGGQPWSTWQVRALLERGRPLFSATVVAMGMFDGVHLGHRRILTEARAMAERGAGVPVALTFDRHPSALLRPEEQPGALNTFEERVRLLLDAGVEHVVVLEFDRELSRFEPEAFLEEVLASALGARGIVVGDDFRFGRDAKGDASLLERVAPTFGWQLRLVRAVEEGGGRISSTRVRQSLERGDVEGAARLLGRPYAVEGEVVEGERLGRTLGYPTANLALAPELALPGDGVYLARARLGAGEERRGLVAIGTRPSVGGAKRTFELHLLDFEGDLYGRRLRVELLARLRGIVRFDSLEALKAQIARDVTEARRRFGMSAE